MKVRAKFPESNKFGWYDNSRKYDGDVFELANEKHFSENWMVRLEEPKPQPEPEPFAPVDEGVKPSEALSKAIKKAPKKVTKKADTEPFV